MPELCENLGHLEPNVVIGLRLPRRDLARLRQLSRVQERTQVVLIRRAVREMLEREMGPDES